MLRLIAMGAMAALHARETSSLGQEVQSALFENNVFLVAQHMMQFAVTGQPALPFAPITRPEDLLDGTRPGVRLNPPRLGEHSAEILAELGYSAIEIEALCAR